ncbi:formate dehydrogenase subunit delta [Saccharospirillum mangrovi]|uniref:formate dehydrogenase subunit delta n=1 Tax=Saccharospirillum mangrovi TaxID=2161747 RepID=UPI000D389128|nr:formate dehydrogenase subunit delta [Saccharospirillum mangrovi]
MSQQTQKLIKMINQIADNISATLDEDKAAEIIATHVRKFWAKPMKDDIRKYLETGGAELTARAKRAVQLL